MYSSTRTELGYGVHSSTQHPRITINPGQTQQHNQKTQSQARTLFKVPTTQDPLKQIACTSGTLLLQIPNLQQLALYIN
jgi:hypothetical protein